MNYEDPTQPVIEDPSPSTGGLDANLTTPGDGLLGKDPSSFSVTLPVATAIEVPPPKQGTFEYIKHMQFKAQQDKLAEKQRIDSRAELAIKQQQLKAESDARTAALLARVDSLSQTLRTAPPASHANPTMDPAEVWAGLISGALLGNVAQGANVAYSNASRRTAIEDENATNADHANRMVNQALLEQSMHEIGNEDTYRRSIDNQSIDSLQSMVNYDHQSDMQDKRLDVQDAKAMRGAFETAKTKGDIETTARLLQKFHPEQAPTETEVKAKVQQAGQAAAKEYNQAVDSFWKTAGNISDADRQKFEAWRQSLADTKDGYGIPEAQLMKVPDSKTLGLKRSDEMARHNQEIEKQARERFTWEKDVKVRRQLEISWYNAQTARESAIQAQQRNDIASMQFYQKAFDDHSTDFMVEIGKKLKTVDQQIAGKTAELQKARGKKARELQADVDNLHGQQRYLLSQVDEQNAARVAFGMPSTDPADIVQKAEEFAKQRQQSYQHVGTSKYTEAQINNAWAALQNKYKGRVPPAVKAKFDRAVSGG